MPSTVLTYKQENVRSISWKIARRNSHLNPDERILNPVLGDRVDGVQSVRPRSNGDLLYVSHKRQSPVNAGMRNLAN